MENPNFVETLRKAVNISAINQEGFSSLSVEFTNPELRDLFAAQLEYCLDHQIKLIENRRTDEIFDIFDEAAESYFGHKEIHVESILTLDEWRGHRWSVDWVWDNGYDGPDAYDRLHWLMK